MPNNNDEIDDIEIANLKLASDILLQALVINAVRCLVAVLIAQWVLRSRGASNPTHHEMTVQRSASGR